LLRVALSAFEGVSLVIKVVWYTVATGDRTYIASRSAWSTVSGAMSL